MGVSNFSIAQQSHGRFGNALLDLARLKVSTHTIARAVVFNVTRWLLRTLTSFIVSFRRPEAVTRLTMPASNGASASGLQSALTSTATPRSDAKEIASRQRRLPASASGYTLCQQIGRGTAANVYRALLNSAEDSSTEVAIKVIDLEWLQAPLDDIWREIQVMSLSSHPNVVPFSTAFVNGADLWIVMPLLTGGSVLDLMTESYPTGLPESLAVYVIYSVLNAIDYFHDNNQIHRDVKARNVLLDSKGNVMLSDYGMMGWMVEGGWERKQRQTFIGTPCWMAPEVMEQANGYDYKADIWSLGITAIEIAQGMAPYSTAAPIKVLLMTLQNPPPKLDKDVADRFSSEYKDFIATCLQKDPTQRPTSKELLQHPLFANGVTTPPDLESILAKLPPIGSRGNGQNNLIQQINKNHTVARSGIFELSSKGQGWDFGDGDYSVPESSSDTLNTEESTQNGKAGNTSGTQVVGDGASTERRLSSLDDGSGRTSPPSNSANKSAVLPTEPGSVSGATSTLAAKTVGMLQRKGRFTVSDVGDKVEHCIADFLDDDSSGGISNSSSFTNMVHNTNNDGSPSSALNGHSRTVRRMPQPVAVAPSISGTASQAPVTASAPTAAPSASGLASSQANNTPPSASVSNLPPSATVTTNSQANGNVTVSQATTDPTERIRKSRFEVYDIESSGTTKNNNSSNNNPTVRASTLSSSGASTPNQSGIMRIGKPRSRGRFEVKDIEPSGARLPTVAAISTQTGTASPRRTVVATPSVQSQSKSQPSVLQQTSVISQQQVNSESKTTETAQTMSRVNTEQVQQNVAPPAEKPAAPQPQRATLTTHTNQVDPRLTPAQPAVSATTVPAPAPTPTHMPPAVQQQPTATPTTHDYSRWGYQALMDISRLQSDLLHLVQEHERVKQENEYFRHALSTNQQQIQISTGLMGQMQGQLTFMGQQVLNLQMELQSMRQCHQTEIAQMASLGGQRPSPVEMYAAQPHVPSPPQAAQERVFVPPVRPRGVQPFAPISGIPVLQQSQHIARLVRDQLSAMRNANATLLGLDLPVPQDLHHSMGDQTGWPSYAPSPNPHLMYNTTASSSMPAQHNAPPPSQSTQSIHHPSGSSQLPAQHSTSVHPSIVSHQAPPQHQPAHHAPVSTQASSQHPPPVHPSTVSHQTQKPQTVHVSAQIPSQRVAPPLSQAPQQQQQSAPTPSDQTPPVAKPTQKPAPPANGVVVKPRHVSAAMPTGQRPAAAPTQQTRQQPTAGQRAVVLSAPVNTGTTRPTVSAGVNSGTTRPSTVQRTVVSSGMASTPAKATLAAHVAASNAVHQHMAATSAASGRPVIQQVQVRTDTSRLAHSVSAPNNSLNVKTHPSQTEYGAAQQQHPSQTPIEGGGLPTTASAPSLSLTDNTK